MRQNRIIKPYALIDLHCDTLTDGKYTSTGKLDTLDDPERVLSLSCIPEGVHWAQFYAVFIPDEVRGQEAIDYYEFNRDSFYRQMNKFNNRVMPCRTANEMKAAWAAGKVAAFLTIENGSAIAGDLKRVKLLADDGVRAITLVWNGENELGSGHTTDHGLSDFGKVAVGELENQGIIVDISHLNDSGFDDLLKVAKKPFMATHSNARAVCSHKRNLTDEMIKEMVHRDCLIGLNYFIKFIKDDGNVKVIGSIKTSSKDRIDKIFVDKFIYNQLTEKDTPHIAIFLNDVQRKKTRVKNKFGINATFLPGHFKGYTVKLNPLDGVYYCDIRPNMRTEDILKDHIKTFDNLLIEDIWKFLK